jgi:hypothetical protein
MRGGKTQIHEKRGKGEQRCEEADQNQKSRKRAYHNYAKHRCFAMS